MAVRLPPPDASRRAEESRNDDLDLIGAAVHALQKAPPAPVGDDETPPGPESDADPLPEEGESDLTFEAGFEEFESMLGDAAQLEERLGPPDRDGEVDEEGIGWAVGTEFEFLDDPEDEWDGPVGDGLDEEEGIGGISVRMPVPDLFRDSGAETEDADTSDRPLPPSRTANGD